MKRLEESKTTPPTVEQTKGLDTMKRVSGPKTAISRIPCRAETIALFIGPGIYLGASSPSVGTCGKKAMTRLGSSRSENFDTDISKHSEKESDSVRQATNYIQPRPKRAHILIRKQQVQIAYMLGECGFPLPRRYVPELIPSSEIGTIARDDLEEAQALLEEAHETLFKKVISLNPEILLDACLSETDRSFCERRKETFGLDGKKSWEWKPLKYRRLWARELPYVSAARQFDNENRDFV